MKSIRFAFELGIVTVILTVLSATISSSSVMIGGWFAVGALIAAVVALYLLLRIETDTRIRLAGLLIHALFLVWVVYSWRTLSAGS